MSQTKAAFLLLVSCFLLNSFASAIVKEEGFRRGYFRSAKGMVLSGHVISTHHVTSPFDCSFLCTAEVQCLSYNYKPKGAGDKDVCDLTNGTRKASPASYEDNALYTHYYDGETEDAKSCLDFLRKGATEDGIYTITSSDGSPFKVWCDLSSEPGSAWTLILSFAHKNRDITRFCSVPLTEDKPSSKNDPNWELHRQTFNRMQTISSQSTHLRITSSFPVYGVDYRDYLRAKFSSIDILTFTGRGICKTVELIDIRGTKGTDITVAFWQGSDFIFHTDSSRSPCQYDAGSTPSESNFGFTCQTFNPATRGSETDHSTIQYWFGGYL